MGGTEKLSIMSNLPWTTTISDTWIEVLPSFGTGSATLTVTATENTSTQSRTGSIIFDAGGSTYVVSVTQDKP